MTWRDLTDADLEMCLDLQPACIGDRIVGRCRALRAWHTLLISPACIGAVIEANPSIGGHHLIACGLGVFVSRAFADLEVANPAPDMNSRIIASVAADQDVVLTRKGLGYGNAGPGLDFVNMYGVWRPQLLSPSQTAKVHALMAASFMESHAGYRMNRVLKEAIGAAQIGLARASGMWQLLKAFPERESALFMVHPKEDAVQVPYSTMAALYYYREPVLGFRDSHQGLLREALKGATDSELAVRLNLSVAAIKKRWESIFAKCDQRNPSLLEYSETARTAVTSRGLQKRHRVLSYVRDHPEELRPYAETAPGTTGRDGHE